MGMHQMGKAVFSSEKMSKVREAAITRLGEDGFRSEFYRIKPLFEALKNLKGLIRPRHYPSSLSPRTLILRVLGVNYLVRSYYFI